jgi:hypothetical protein
MKKQAITYIFISAVLATGILCGSAFADMDAKSSMMDRQDRMEMKHEKRMEMMAASDGAGKSVGILAALAAIGSPVLAEQPISMFNGARVNKKTLTAAKNREFCNLADFVPPNHVLLLSLVLMNVQET